MLKNFAGGAYLMKSSSKRDIRGRVVLITGGGGGVGRAAAIAFAQRGARVLLWDVSLAGLEASEAAVRAVVPGAQVQSVVVDLCSRHAVYKAAAAVQQLQWGDVAAEPVFCIVNNAGIVTGAPLRRQGAARSSAAPWPPFPRHMRTKRVVRHRAS